MSKLALNDDGTVTIPLRGGREALTLPEPSIEQLAEMTSYVADADAALPAIPQLGENPDTASLAKATEDLRDRTKKTYSAESPYGSAIVKMAKLLDAAEITLADLPGWAASPLTCRSILAHFQNPSGGEG